MAESLTDTLRRLEEQLQAASVRSDPGRITELLTDDFREIGSSGRVYTKVDLLSTLPVEKPVRFVMTEFEAALRPGSRLALLLILEHRSQCGHV